MALFKETFDKASILLIRLTNILSLEDVLIEPVTFITLESCYAELCDEKTEILNKLVLQLNRCDVYKTKQNWCRYKGNELVK